MLKKIIFFLTFIYSFFACSFSRNSSPPEAIFEKNLLKIARSLKSKNYKQAQILLVQMTKKEINSNDKSDITLLLYALYLRDTKAIETLLKAGADPNKTVRIHGKENHLVAIASGMQDINILKLLLKYGGDPNGKKEGGTAIFNAINQRDVESLKILIDAGADINKVHDWVSMNAAVYATTFSNYETIHILLLAGIDWEKECQNCLAYRIQTTKEPEDKKQKHYREKVIEFLVNRGVKFPVIPPYILKEQNKLFKKKQVQNQASRVTSPKKVAARVEWESDYAAKWQSVKKLIESKQITPDQLVQFIQFNYSYSDRYEQLVPYYYNLLSFWDSFNSEQQATIVNSFTISTLVAKSKPSLAKLLEEVITKKENKNLFTHNNLYLWWALTYAIDPKVQETSDLGKEFFQYLSLDQKSIISIINKKIQESADHKKKKLWKEVLGASKAHVK